MCEVATRVVVYLTSQENNSWSFFRCNVRFLLPSPPSFLSDASGIGVGGIPVPDPSSLGSFCRVLIGPGFLLGHESGIGGRDPHV